MFFEADEQQMAFTAAFPPPEPPGLAEIQARPETEFRDREGRILPPPLRQAVAGDKDMAAFRAAVAARIKVIAKFRRLGHITRMPFYFAPRRAACVVLPAHICPHDTSKR